VQRTATIKVGAHRVDCRFADRNNSLAPTLPKESYRPFRKIEGVKVEGNDLAHASTRPVQQLTECSGALGMGARKLPLPLWCCERGKEIFNLVRAQHRRKASPRPWQVNLSAN
jgi:hypothetical protein